MGGACILVLPGDGIGPEVTEQAVKVLSKTASLFDLELVIKEGLVGGDAIDKLGSPLPAETLSLAHQADAILLGGVGGHQWDSLPMAKRPEKGLLALRSELGLFANLRPAFLYDSLTAASAIKEDRIAGLDLLIVRELTGGLYFGEPRGFLPTEKNRTCRNTMQYNEMEIKRIARIAFELAAKRKKKLCSVDKANVLEVSQFWREIFTAMAKDYEDIELEHLYVDNAAMQLVAVPMQFDVIVTENTFGDILSDISAQLVGSIGMLPSASLGESGKGLFEPVHGSAPDIAGKNIANPYAAILSIAMMLRYSLGQSMAAAAIEAAVQRAVADGFLTQDLTMDGEAKTCSEAGNAVLERLDNEV